MQNHSDSVTDIDCFDFSALQAYRSHSVGTARVWVNNSAQKRPNEQITLFVHGAYHGAWCYAGFMQFFDGLEIPAAAIDLTGHGGLSAPAKFVEMGVFDFAKDVEAVTNVLDRPTFVVGHSAGALIAVCAAQNANFAGLGFLTPSPPGNLTSALTLPEVPAENPLPVPNVQTLLETYFIGDPPADIHAVHKMLCPESPALMNDRYRKKTIINPLLVNLRGFCIEAEKDDPMRHPDGQDQQVAEFFRLQHFVLKGAPHCVMMSRVWEQCAALLVQKIDCAA